MDRERERRKNRFLRERMRTNGEGGGKREEIKRYRGDSWKRQVRKERKGTKNEEEKSEKREGK